MEPRERHSAVSMKNRIVIFGGIGTNEETKKKQLFNDVWILRISSKKMTFMKPKVVPDDEFGVPCARYHNTACVYGNSMFLFGGFNGTSNLNDIWILMDKTIEHNEDVFEWKKMTVKSSNIPAPRFQHSACVYKDVMIVHGGKGDKILGDTWSFSFKTEEWTLLNVNNPEPRYGHSCAVIHDYIFIFGGHRMQGNWLILPNDLYTLDMVEMEWEKRKTPNGPFGRVLSSCCVFDREKLLIVGGITCPKTYTRSDEIWMLETGLNSSVKKQRLKGYVTLKEIGSGTYATVFLSKKLSDQSYHALKRVILDVKSDIPEDKLDQIPHSSFDALREADLLKSLHHEHILNIEDYFLVKLEDKVCVAIITPYCDLNNLHVYLTKNQFSELEILFLFVQFLEGMRYLHKSSVLHRDIKPQNILVQSIYINGEKVPSIKIADFGFAKSIKGRTNTFVGTRNFMAPEFFHQKNSFYGEGIDIWAIGCLLYFMLTKKEVDFKKKEVRQGLNDQFKKFQLCDLYSKWINSCVDENVDDRISAEKLYAEALSAYETMYERVESEVKQNQPLFPMNILKSPKSDGSTDSPPILFLQSPRSPTFSPPLDAKRAVSTPTDQSVVALKKYLNPSVYLTK